MKKLFTTIILLTVAAITIQAAKPRTSLKVSSTRKQTVTGFGGACCDGAMKPFGTDNACVGKLYGAKSKIGLNILRMEISPNLEDKADQWGDYDWCGRCLRTELGQAVRQLQRRDADHLLFRSNQT